MTSKEFILWLKGFSEGVHEYNITPKQWDLLKDKLGEVKDEPSYTFPMTTTQIYPSGSAWSYTNSTYRPYTTDGEDEVIKTHNED